VSATTGTISKLQIRVDESLSCKRGSPLLVAQFRFFKG
jgi:hypothetical protein